MSGVSNTIQSGLSPIFGGNKTPTTNSTPGMSPQDQATQDWISQQIQGDYTNQEANGTPISQQFQQHLSDFLNSSNVNPSQDQVNQATNFVDQTYTNPQQIALNQYNQAYGANQNATAAAMGRNPNDDIATQQAIYGEGLRSTAGLQAQRGSLIQQQAQNLNNMNYQRGAGTSSFLNGLQQQAFQNQMGLMNGLTGQMQFNQNDRFRNGSTTQGGTNPGLIGSLGSAFNTASAAGQSFQNGMGGGGSSGGGGSIGSSMGTQPNLGVNTSMGPSLGSAPSYGFLGG